MDMTNHNESAELARTDEEVFWEDVRRTQKETSAIPGIDLKALVAESRAAFWSVRKSQIAGEIDLKKKSLELKQGEELTPEELAWSKFYSDADLNESVTRAALRLFDPVKEFVRDLASSLAPQFFVLGLLVVAYVLWLNRPTMSLAALPLAAGVILFLLAASITLHLTLTRRPLNVFGIARLQNSTGSLVGALFACALVAGLFAYTLRQKTVVHSQRQANATIRHEWGVVQGEVQLSTIVNKLMPVAASVFTDPQGKSLEESVDMELAKSALAEGASLKKIQANPNAVVYDVTQNNKGADGVPVRVTFTNDKVEVGNRGQVAYRIEPLKLQEAETDQVTCGSDSLQEKKIKLRLYYEQSINPEAKNSVFSSLKGRDVVVTYDLASNTLVGLGVTEAKQSSVFYYKDALPNRIERLSLMSADVPAGTKKN
jgi:hypothetical protein